MFVTDRKAEPGLVKVRKLEERYARDLRKIARHVGEIVKAWAGEGDIDPSRIPALKEALDRYAAAIRPWAGATAGRMVQEIAIRDRREWARHASAMSRSLRREIREAPTGQVLRQRLQEQVGLITSLPTQTAQRVHDLTLKGLTDSTRASEIAREIMRSGEVTVARANLIARTEVSRTASSLLQARAQHVGSTTYIWRTAKDSDVRPSHRTMEGKAVDWNAPPTLDGLTGHAGMLPNCRCYAEPVLPEV